MADSSKGRQPEGRQGRTPGRKCGRSALWENQGRIAPARVEDLSVLFPLGWTSKFISGTSAGGKRKGFLSEPPLEARLAWERRSWYKENWSPWGNWERMSNAMTCPKRDVERPTLPTLSHWEKRARSKWSHCLRNMMSETLEQLLKVFTEYCRPRGNTAQRYCSVTSHQRMELGTCVFTQN